MPNALIGHTGFVGGHLKRQVRFDALYRSTDIAAIEGRRFDLLVCAGAPAAKWKANKEPEADRANLARLMSHLERVRADRFVLVSTVDVYPSPCGVDEDTPIASGEGSAYGRHRLELERFARERFGAAVVRLPGLFGAGLKKNVVYDLLHDNCLDQLQPLSAFQFYALELLWRDVTRALERGIEVLNVAVEPVTVADVAREAFGRALPPSADPVARYDFRTRHGAAWGRSDGYLYGRAEMLERLRTFVAAERAAQGAR